MPGLDLTPIVSSPEASTSNSSDAVLLSSNADLSTSSTSASGYSQCAFTLPKYSDHIQTLLDSQEVHKEWPKFIEETAYHVIANHRMQDRGDYAEFGRYVYTKYPCVKHKGPEPWVS